MLLYQMPALRTFNALLAGLLLGHPSSVQSSLVPEAQSTNPAALNKLPYNSLPNAGGPRLYYNGTGNVPPYDQLTPAPSPITPFSAPDLYATFLRDITAINSNNSYYDSECSKCIATTDILHLVAASQPVSVFTDLYIQYCEMTDMTVYAVNCYAEYASTPKNQSAFSSGAAGEGAWYAQLYSKLSQATGDMQALCYYNFETCDRPPVVKIDESKYFSPKPESANMAPAPSGKTFDVLHISDWHLDARFDIGSEANCTTYLCCRPYSLNEDLNTTSSNPSIPASRFGDLFCDSPPDLAISAFNTMPSFFDKDKVGFAIFTGDIVSHDNDDQLSQAYVGYEEQVTYQTFKAHMGNVPIYATLGNHDNWPEAFNTPNNINDGSNVTSNAMSWNYDLLTSLWSHAGWITGSEAAYARTHYGAYAHTTPQGLRIISINTDFWYNDNVFNYYNFTNPDNSGVLSFLADELSACEKRGQRAWVIGHVLSGYDGSNALPNPSALFYSIVRRFSPATIALVAFGHTHEDQLQIFYDYAPQSMGADGLRNTTMVDYSKPLMIGRIGPSITPLTGLNSGYQRLQVDSKTFEVMGVQTYFANMSESLTWSSPVWKFEYDTRSTYNVGGINWPKSAPLNATFFDKVTSVMLKNQSLVETYNFLETKKSVATESCTSKACGIQKVCYIRSGSAALGLACPQNSDFPYRKRSCH